MAKSLQRAGYDIVEFGEQAGVILTTRYKPSANNITQNTSPVNMAIVFFFASLDAVIAGYVYNIFEIKLLLSIFYMGFVSLIAALCALQIPTLLKPEIYLSERLRMSSMKP